MAPGGTVNLKLEKLRGLTGKLSSMIVSVCDIVMNSRSSCAAEFLLRTVLGLERLRTSLSIGTGAGAAAAALFPAAASPVPAPGVVTGCPHLRQNCDSSGSSVLHLLQDRVIAEGTPAVT